MIIGGANVQDGRTFEADVCIVGSGAAGLTLALDLARRGASVILVESGGMVFQKQSNDLLDIELGGQSTPALIAGTRERFFGGTTNHWGGVCRTFDDFEFEPHPWVPNSGWPFGLDALDPYYTAAAALLGLPEVRRTYDPEALGVADRPALVRPTERDLQAAIWRRVPLERVRMGPWRKDEVSSNPKIQCVVHTTIAQIHPGPSGEKITSMEGRTFSGRTLHFRARDYVLCTGAVENARLLLASDAVVPHGLGNEHDLVGRYFMDHPANVLGQLLLTDPDAPASQEEHLAENELVGWTTTPAARRAHKLQGFMSWVFPRRPPEKLPYELAIRELVQPLGQRQKPSSSRYLNIVINWEQSPNPLSRVTLSPKLDALGIRKPHLHWAVTAEDLASAKKSCELFSVAVARAGLGRVHLEEVAGPVITMGGGHQMGTTRMSIAPKDGVTDVNGRVHSLDNLFVGGSSLFPTGGWQHPTFSIVALALRQADFLSSRHR
ncbi:MAG: GMC family oxidoreductase [Gammaproteobacteria bacterium]|nr:GMC family oxidoreductase [Gammaproteobacteria bacterium]